MNKIQVFEFYFPFKRSIWITLIGLGSIEDSNQEALNQESLIKEMK